MTDFKKTFLKNKMLRVSSGRKETRNAMVYDVDTSAKTCRVKLQGSSKLVVVHYHENLEQTPRYLKPGNAVKILHTGGKSDKMEIVGNSQVIPTLLGNDVTGPPTTGTTDGVISGFNLRALEDGSMVVTLSTGVFRMNEIIYTVSSFGGIIMESDSTTIMVVDSTDIMSSGYLKYITINDLTTVGQYRIDKIVIGTDKVVDYVVGTVFTSYEDSIIPDTPSGHLLLHTILVVGGAGEIKQYYIDLEWSTPEFQQIEISSFVLTIGYEPDGFDESGYDYVFIQETGSAAESVTLSLQLVDQYGMPFKKSDNILVELELGGATFTNSTEISASIFRLTTNSSGKWTGVFTPEFDSEVEIDPKLSPLMSVTLESDVVYKMIFYVYCYSYVAA